MYEMFKFFFSAYSQRFCAVSSDVMDIPKSLVSEAEEAIKMRLKPILDQAQVEFSVSPLTFC